MSSGKTVVVDFVAKGHHENEWRMVLVEQGPWTEPFEDELRRVQGRLYACIDAAIDGQLAEKFPQTLRQRVIIQLDGYGLPKDEVRGFFDRFAAGISTLPDYRQALLASSYVTDIAFKLNLDDTPNSAAQS